MPSPQVPPPVPSSWDQAFAVYHELWGAARAEAPYTVKRKRQWAALLEFLQHQAGPSLRVGLRYSIDETPNDPGGRGPK